MEGTNPELEPDRERFITHVNYGLMQADGGVRHGSAGEGCSERGVSLPVLTSG